MIRVENLTKRFGQVVAVDDLSFEVARGDVLGFLGPNGAGKTTTMRILTGFLPPTEGRLSVAGHDIFDEPIEAKRCVGYLPERVPVYPEMVVTDYLHFVSELRSIPKPSRATAVERSLELTNLTDRRSRIIGHLSKGLMKRVGIAQALLGDPDILILDEPTEGLDPKQQVSIRELITSLAGERTLILSTHILTEVEQTCSRVLIIDRGRLVAADSVEAIRANVSGHRTKVRMEVLGSPERVRDAIATIAGVGDLNVTSDGEDRTMVHLSLEADEISAEVAGAVVGAGLGLLEMTRERMSLEQVFIRLTRDEAPRGAEVGK